MRKVPVWALKPGMEVARQVYDSNGHLLLNAGVRLEVEYIQSLKKLNIPAVYVVNPLIPDIKVEDVILCDTRHKAMRLAQKILTANLNAPPNTRSFVSRLFSYKKELNEVVDEIISQLLDCRELVINLCGIRTVDNYTFAHSANVAVLSLISATAMGFSRSELRTVGQGSFLHDLGKSLISPSVLNKTEQLLPEERQEIKQHPAYGYDLIKQQPFADSVAAKIVYQHHERIDGQGYPEGITGRDIHVYSKICAIADVYDALVSDRPYRPAYPPHRVLEMFQSGEGGYDPEIFQVFSQHVAAYPVGTVVGLSNGLIGIVVQNYAGYSTRPKVRVFCEKDNLERLPAYEM
ncbi:MAG TPA: HD-GYP domain-containing protein, partial [Firmicutes bacterium]|nr:HD-GYP domain-containing protein [Bacillota bacterium]